MSPTVVTDMQLQSVGWITGTWHPDGRFEIPTNAASLVVTAQEDGERASFTRRNASPIAGRIDPVARTVSFNRFSQSEDDTEISLGLSGSNITDPPLAVITLPTTIECNQKNAAAVTLDSTASTDPNNDIAFSMWRVNGGPAVIGSQVSATLNLGTNELALRVFDSTFAIGVADETITVVDTTPPTFEALQPVTDSVCNPDFQAAPIATPIATDICSPTVTVTGAIIASDGQPRTPALPIENGAVLVPPGVHTVEWTATDESGRVSTTTQTFTVRPAIEASESIGIAGRARVALPGGGFATLGNTGDGLVSLGVEAETGSIFTQDGVTLHNRSIVHGNVRAAGSVTRKNGATVTGTVTSGAPVSLPPGPDLSDIVFPSSNAGDVVLEGDGLRTLEPGAYASVVVKPGGRLTLTAGVYFFESLALQPHSVLALDQSAGAVKLYVETSMTVHGQIAPIAGAPGGFVLGYAGTHALSLKTPFLAGTVIAPNAKVVVASPGADAFTGQLFAKQIEVQPNAVLTCDPVGGLAPQAFSLARLQSTSERPAPSFAPVEESDSCGLATRGAHSGWFLVTLASLIAAGSMRRIGRRKAAPRNTETTPDGRP